MSELLNIKTGAKNNSSPVSYTLEVSKPNDPDDPDKTYTTVLLIPLGGINESDGGNRYEGKALVIDNLPQGTGRYLAAAGRVAIVSCNPYTEERSIRPTESRS